MYLIYERLMGVGDEGDRDFGLEESGDDPISELDLENDLKGFRSDYQIIKVKKGYLLSQDEKVEMAIMEEPFSESDIREIKKFLSNF